MLGEVYQRWGAFARPVPDASWTLRWFVGREMANRTILVAQNGPKFRGLYPFGRQIGFCFRVCPTSLVDLALGPRPSFFPPIERPEAAQSLVVQIC